MISTVLLAAASGAALGLAVARLAGPLNQRSVEHSIRLKAQARHLARVLRKVRPTSPTERLRILAWVIGGIAAAALTGWPVIGLALVCTGTWLPWLLGSTRVAREQIEVLANLATWCRRMADVLVGGGAAGLTEAIIGSGDSAPERIAVPVRRLAAALRHGREDRVTALASFADEIDDRVADSISAALTLALLHQTPGVGMVLRQLATSVEREVRSRREVEADRAEPRQSIVMLLVIQAGVFVLLALAPGFADAYRTLGGQLVMATLLMGTAALLIWMRRLALGSAAPRFLGRLR